MDDSESEPYASISLKQAMMLNLSDHSHFIML